MSLSQKAIEEFKQIYLDEFKEELSDAQAQEIGEHLIALFKIICRPIPKMASKNNDKNTTSDSYPFDNYLQKRDDELS